MLEHQPTPILSTGEIRRRARLWRDKLLAIQFRVSLLTHDNGVEQRIFYAGGEGDVERAVGNRDGDFWELVILRPNGIDGAY